MLLCDHRSTFVFFIYVLIQVNFVHARNPDTTLGMRAVGEYIKQITFLSMFYCSASRKGCIDVMRKQPLSLSPISSPKLSKKYEILCTVKKVAIIFIL